MCLTMAMNKLVKDESEVIAWRKFGKMSKDMKGCTK